MSAAPVSFTPGEGGVMVRWPSGRVEFMGLWAATVLMYRLGLRKVPVCVEASR